MTTEPSKELYEVVGSRTVAGVDPGGTVELDPAEVNIGALIAAGHIRARGGEVRGDAPPARGRAQAQGGQAGAETG